MKSIYVLLISLIVLFFTADLLGQKKVSTKKVKEIKELFDVGNSNYFEKKDVIFEGTILDRKKMTHVDSEGPFQTKHNYVVYKVLVHKKFKGSLESGTVEIVHRGPNGSGHGLLHRIGDVGIFSGLLPENSIHFFGRTKHEKQFLTDNEQMYHFDFIFPYRLDDFYKTLNSENYSKTNQACCSLVYYRNPIGYFIRIDTAAEVYAFLESYEGLQMVDFDGKLFEMEDKDYFKAHHQKKRRLKRWNKWINKDKVARLRHSRH